MQIADTATAEQPELKRAKPHTLRKRIGSTVYEVSVHFSTENTETLKDKIQRLTLREVMYDE